MSALVQPAGWNWYCGPCSAGEGPYDTEEAAEQDATTHNTAEHPKPPEPRSRSGLHGVNDPARRRFHTTREELARYAAEHDAARAKGLPWP